MDNINKIQLRKWYNFLSELDAKRFCLNNHFTEGNISDLGSRKPFSYSKAGPDGYLPVIFPSWTWVEKGIPLLKEGSSNLTFVDMAYFFGFDISEIHQICIAKNYNIRPCLDSCIRRIHGISKAYGIKLNE